MTAPAPWSSYVALGDSFTEGLWDVVDDDARPDPEMSAWATANPHAPETRWLHLRGWADLLAGHLADRRPEGESVRYANLAVRGKLLPAVVTEQVPVALELEPDLVSLIAGGNDILRPSVDVDAIADRLEDAVVRLREAGIAVLLATGVDAKGSMLISSTRTRVGIFNSHIWSIARRHDAMVLDVWGMRSLHDLRMWSGDRIHLVADGHRRVAQAALVGLGQEPDDAAWDDPLTPLVVPVRDRVTSDAAWFREHAYPWATRRLRGRSSGDTRQPKQPELVTVERRA
ncbi:SGNH/GDSL hydrolase family protein [Serinibacter arcticus]